MITPMTVLVRLRDRLSSHRAAAERRRASLIDAEESQLSDSGRQLRRLAIHEVREQERTRRVRRTGGLN